MDDNREDPKRAVEKRFNCPMCTMKFSYKCVLKMHCQRRHTDVWKYPCSCCDKKFKVRADLMQHNLIHMGERPFKCTEGSCRQAFREFTIFRKHLKYHGVYPPPRGKESIICWICNRKFLHEASLNRHLQRWFDGVARKRSKVHEEFMKTLKDAYRQEPHQAGSQNENGSIELNELHAVSVKDDHKEEGFACDTQKSKKSKRRRDKKDKSKQMQSASLSENCETVTQMTKCGHYTSELNPGGELKKRMKHFTCKVDENLEQKKRKKFEHQGENEAMIPKKNRKRVNVEPHQAGSPNENGSLELNELHDVSVNMVKDDYKEDGFACDTQKSKKSQRRRDKKDKSKRTQLASLGENCDTVVQMTKCGHYTSELNRGGESKKPMKHSKVDQKKRKKFEHQRENEAMIHVHVPKKNRKRVSETSDTMKRTSECEFDLNEINRGGEPKKHYSEVEKKRERKKRKNFEHQKESEPAIPKNMKKHRKSISKESDTIEKMSKCENYTNELNLGGEANKYKQSKVDRKHGREKRKKFEHQRESEPTILRNKLKVSVNMVKCVTPLNK